jgi:glucosamine--fructose-6-phosphate aminotransferase (isomerizing)
VCGIVGYIGPREAGPILLEGLARLEYRGYDSAGIALVTSDGDLFVEKRAGKLSVLRTALVNGTPSAAVGLAHTRWATHGRPNDLNAHPHVDCTGDVTVIHNGIIENFRELRDRLEAGGHRLQSETDTEAIAHLVEEAYEGDIAAAVRVALRSAHGAYALAVMHKDEPGRLVGARMNVPLVVGLGAGESFLASDVAAILAHTNRVIYLEEGDVADLRTGDVAITAVDGTPRQRAIHTIDWSIEAAEKGGYPHFMLKEMHEQPEAIRSAITGRLAGDRIRLEELEPLRARLEAVQRVEFVACGSAYYASGVASYLFQDWLGLPARATVGSEFRYSPPPLDAGTLVVAVTQSGETADTLAPTRYAREQGSPVVAVTNTVGSAITREADAVVFLQAGPEICVVATKTFASQVTTLVLLGAALARLRGRFDAGTERELVTALRELPGKAARALELAAPAKELARRYVNSRGFMFVGRGTGFPVAMEGALKLKEVSYVHAEGYPAGELKHGPIALLDAEVPLVAVATRSAVQEKLISNVMEGRARDARVIAVATEGDDGVGQVADDVFWVPETIEPLSPILAVIPLQLFAYHTAVARGTDVDQPRNLAKTVTVELLRGGRSARPRRDDRARDRHREGRPDPRRARPLWPPLLAPRPDPRRGGLRAGETGDVRRTMGREGGGQQGAGPRRPRCRLARH